MIVWRPTIVLVHTLFRMSPWAPYDRFYAGFWMKSLNLINRRICKVPSLPITHSQCQWSTPLVGDRGEICPQTCPSFWSGFIEAQFNSINDPVVVNGKKVSHSVKEFFGSSSWLEIPRIRASALDEESKGVRHKQGPGVWYLVIKWTSIGGKQRCLRPWPFVQQRARICLLAPDSFFPGFVWLSFLRCLIGLQYVSVGDYDMTKLLFCVVPSL